MFTRTALVLAVALGLAAPAFSQAKPETDEQKTVYSIGVALAQSLQPYYLTPAEVKLVQQGLVDGLDNKPQVDLKDYRVKLQQLAQDRAKSAAEAEKKEAQSFLDKMAKEKGAQKTESGLIFIEMEPGKGASPQATDTVKVNYHGTLRDGTVFDSSRRPRHAGDVPAEPRHPVLDRGGAEDEGRWQGEDHLPVEHRLRRSRRAAEDQAGRSAGLRGRAARASRSPLPLPRRAHRARRLRRRSRPRSKLHQSTIRRGPFAGRAASRRRAMSEYGFWNLAQRDPEHLALVEPDGREWRAGELLAEANRLVHGLRALGLRQGDCVATCLPNDAAMLITYLAAAQSGLVPHADQSSPDGGRGRLHRRATARRRRSSVPSASPPSAPARRARSVCRSAPATRWARCPASGRFASLTEGQSAEHAERSRRRAGDELHVRHDRPAEGRAPAAGTVRSRHGLLDVRHVPRHVRHPAARRQRPPLRLAAVPHRGAGVRRLVAALRPHRRADGEVDAGALPRRHPALSRHHQPHGADAVPPPAGAARGREAALRRVVAAPHGPRRGAVSGGREATHDRVVGTGRSTSTTPRARAAARWSPPRSGSRYPGTVGRAWPSSEIRIYDDAGNACAVGRAGDGVHGARRGRLQIPQGRRQDGGQPPRRLLHRRRHRLPERARATCSSATARST